jgi:hypothetical protein
MKRTCLIGLLLGMAVSLPATVGSTATFYRDVLPILQNHCQNCHRPGRLAPISFMSYRETRPWADAMKYAVVSKQMPPWYGERPYVPSSLREHGSLKVSEVETIVRWVEQGAPAGDPKDAPPPIYYQQTRIRETPIHGNFIPVGH